MLDSTKYWLASGSSSRGESALSFPAIGSGEDASPSRSVVVAAGPLSRAADLVELGMGLIEFSKQAR